MTNFNLTPQEGGYQQRPTPVRSDLDASGDMKQTLIGLLGKVAEGAISKALKPAADMAPMEELNAKQTDIAKLALASPEARSGELVRRATSETVGSDGDLYESLIDKQTGKISEKALAEKSGAIAEWNKRIDVASAKAQQRGRNFNYQGEVMGAYADIVNKYGVGPAAAAFEELNGTKPLKFMTEELVKAEFAARQKMEEASAKQTADLAARFNLARPAGMTEAQFADYTSKYTTTVYSLKDSSTKLEAWNIQAENGQPVPDNVRKPVESRFGSDVISSVSVDLEGLTGNFDPATATPEMVEGMLQQLSDLENGYTSKVLQYMSTDATGRGYTTDNIKTQIAAAKDLVTAKTRTDVLDNKNKMRSAKALDNLFQNVPNYGELSNISKDMGTLITTDKLFATGFSDLVSTSAGMDISKLLIANDFNSYARNGSPKPGEWMQVNKRVLGMAAGNQQFAGIMAMGSVKALYQAVDPVTGEIKDVNAMTGLVNLYGSKEYLKYIYPEIKGKMGNYKYDYAMNELSNKIVGSMFNKIDESPELKETFAKAKTGGERVVVVDFSPEGNAILNYVDSNGKTMVISNQNKGKLNEIRNTISATVRAESHIHGTEDYGNTLMSIFDRNGYQFNFKYVSRAQYEASLKATETKDK